MICWADVPFSAEGYNVHEVFVQVIKNIMTVAEVYLNCGMGGSIDRCKDVLERNGIEIEKIHFTQFEDELYWARDYGPDFTVLLAEVTETEAEKLPSAKITRERLERAYEVLSKETDCNGKVFRNQSIKKICMPGRFWKQYFRTER